MYSSSHTCALAPIDSAVAFLIPPIALLFVTRTFPSTASVTCVFVFVQVISCHAPSARFAPLNLRRTLAKEDLAAMYPRIWQKAKACVWSLFGYSSTFQYRRSLASPLRIRSKSPTDALGTAVVR